MSEYNENENVEDVDDGEDVEGVDGGESDENDVRRLAAERLAYLAVLQFQHRRRGGRGEPWRDPRHGQGRVLALLKLKPEMAQRELTYLMGMSRQSIAELLGKLEKQGFVEREPSPENRRSVIVRLTEKGQAASQGDAPGAPGISGVLECLSDDEVAALADYLGRIIERLEEESGAEMGPRREMIERFWRERSEDPRWRGGPGFGPGFGGFAPGFGPGPGFGPDFGPGPDEPGREGPHGPHGHGPHGPGHHGPGPHGPGHHGPHGPGGPHGGPVPPVPPTPPGPPAGQE